MANGLKSTVELYRSGEILEVPYDLSDPLQRSIWSALQLYMDHVGTLSGGRRKLS